MSRPRSMTPMRSASVIASLWSCVTMTKVRPSRRCNSISSNCVSPRSFLSSAASGSSSSSSARPLDQRPRQRHALALAAGKLVRLAAPEIFELEHRQHVGDALPDLPPGQTLLLEAEGDIGLDVEVREQGVALEHHVDRPPVRRHRREIDPVEHDPAGVRPFEAGDQAQERGLAATRWSEQGEEFAFKDIEREMIDCRSAAEALGRRPRGGAADAGSDRPRAQNLSWLRRSACALQPRRRAGWRAAQHLEHDRENLNLVPPTGRGRPEK